MKIKTILAILLLLLITAGAGFVLWASNPLGPMPEAQAAMSSDSQVQVEVGDYFVFSPLQSNPVTGAIIYPGGRVDPRAYAPLAKEIAARGYLVVIAPMPLNLAVFGADQAGEVIQSYPQIERWAVGGHSLGGAMVARYAFRHPGQVSGLFLWAAYPASSDDLSNQNLTAVSISGTLDGLATSEKIEASRPLLPASTRWVAIDGGNHSQFGWYGPQGGDNGASVDHLTQQTQIVAATTALMDLIAAH